ncbi:efflux RND transporter periplasmic adaptor subunit [Nitratireductor thuwali]|uniref:Multidrug resistance protein MdtA n=1 Tax=Nitratireductor thuwali TaxID=2267699 RepID=A0ABY5MRH2_9HYPH|nr:Multidrug resistance protein MdtA [Nitratireductor thuwali]
MRTSTWIAIGLLAATAAWLASGLFIGTGEGEEEDAAASAQPQPTLVEVESSAARTVPQYIYAQGVAQPFRTADVVSATGGTLAEVPVQQGDHVEAGTVLAQLRLEERQSQLASAEARVESLEADLEGMRRLEREGFAAETRVRELESQLKEARSALQSVRAEIRDTTIEAPISGIVSDVFVNSGETVAAGTAIARLVDNTPLRVTLDISQRDVGSVDVGRVAVVSFATGGLAKGRVCFVAPTADPQTRTFRVETRVPNEERKIPSVVSAEVRFQSGEVKAHFISPAILSLSEEGALGVKSVDEDNTVRFHPVEIARTGMEGAWVSGLPDELRLITTGQGFVREGERVRVSQARAEEEQGDGVARLPTATVEARQFDGAEDLPEPPPAEELCEGSAANALPASPPAASAATGNFGPAPDAAGAPAGISGQAAEPQASPGSARTRGGTGAATGGAASSAPSARPVSPGIPTPRIEPVQPQGQGATVQPQGQGRMAAPPAGSAGGAGGAP